jgi:uracil-DNA glycosylase family 4
MTTILKQMGVQQWRLRQPRDSSVSLLELDSAESAGSEYSVPSTPVASGLAFATSDKASSDLAIGHRAGVAAGDSGLTTDGAENESQASIKPFSSPVVETAKVVAPMLATPMPVALVPAGSPMAMPTVTAMPAPSSPQIQANRASPERDQTPGLVIADSLEQLDWQGLQDLVDNQSQCQSCGPVNSILGSGDPKADWLFVTDAPTSTDLASQQLFSGRAGQLYQAMLLAVGLTRESAYTTSVFKCATSDDIRVIPSCETLLHRQIELIQPKVVIAFGEFAAQSVAKSNEGLESLRSQDLRCYQTKVPIVASYSLSQLLDQPTLKAGAWQDLKKCLAITH